MKQNSLVYYYKNIKYPVNKIKRLETEKYAGRKDWQQIKQSKGKFDHHGSKGEHLLLQNIMV